MGKFVHFEFPQSIEKSIRDLKTKSPVYWENLGQEKVLTLTNFVIRNVPAYRKFLKENKAQVVPVKNINSFKNLPWTNKENYLRKYNYLELFPKGYSDLITTVSSTSGSTGEPFYFPRGEEQDRQYEYVAEIFLKNQFDIDKKRTLAINGFGLGIWIGGIFTYKIFNKIAQKGYKLAVAPTGRDIVVFLKTFKNMADLFDQVILMGYPPFIKDVVDEASQSHINFKKHEIKIVTATEAFSEEFREYLARKTGIKNPQKDILNIYGSVELGTMSHETPLSNLIRRIAVSDKKIFKGLFPRAKVTPTLVQYYPHIVFFEEVDGEVIASGYGSSIPLIRYRFFDLGGVLSFTQMISKLNDLGVDIFKKAKEVKIEATILELPFVFVHERSDFVVNVRGANVYPGNLRKALEDRGLEKFVTGKFQMIKKEDKDLNEYLEINVELKKGVKVSGNLKNKVFERIVKTLRQDNTEFNNMFASEGERVGPKIVLRTYADPEYFPTDSIKQRWVRK